MKRRLVLGLFSLIGLKVFNSGANQLNTDGFKYLKRYLKDKTVSFDSTTESLIISNNNKNLFKITIEKL